MDRPLSKDGVVSMQQRNSDSTYVNNMKSNSPGDVVVIHGVFKDNVKERNINDKQLRAVSFAYPDSSDGYASVMVSAAEIKESKNNPDFCSMILHKNRDYKMTYKKDDEFVSVDVSAQDMKSFFNAQLKCAFENATDVAEKEGFGAKMRKFGNKVSGKLQSAAVAFRDKVWTPTKQKVSENSKSIASSLSLGYAAYQTQRLRDKAVIREGKIAKYDSYLAEHTPVSQSGIEPVVDSKNVVKEAVASETKAISTTPEVAKKVSQPEIVESSSEGGIIVSEGKSHDSDKSSKESILSEKRASLDAAYREGMANVISKLRDFLNEFDEKSASIEELDCIGMNVQQAGAYMNNMKQMSQVSQSRELPVVEMEDSTEAEVEAGI